MARQQPNEGSRRLIDHVVGPAELKPPRALLATTFDLGPEFFELDFLPSMLRTPSFDDRQPRSRIQLEGQLASMDAIAVMMEARRYQGRPRSLRIDVRPATRGSGVLHAKVTIMVHDRAVRLLVASANLTSSGYRENREVALSLRADERSPETGALVRQALGPMPRLLEPWWSEAAARAHNEALRALNEIKAPETTEDAQFIWGGDREPLWKQFLALWPQGEPVRRIRIVSPFWSDEDGHGPLATLVGELRARNVLADETDVLLVAAPQAETTTTFRPTLPATYGTFDFKSLGIVARAVASKPQIDEQDVGRDDLLQQRALHAKVVLLEGATTSVAYIGSGNFTVPGWGFGSSAAANIEAGVVLRRRGKTRSSLAGLIPPTVGEPVMLGKGTGVIATPPVENEPWSFPTFLKAIELRPDAADKSKLELHVVWLPDRSPSEWSLMLRVDDAPLFSARQSETPGQECALPLSGDAVNHLVRHQVVYVRWADMPGDEPVAFPVNVTLEARDGIPFGDPDAFPGEDQLVAFYQGRITWEEVFPIPHDGEDVDGEENLKPLPSAVDTSKILSYQVRSFVEALRGIRDELRRSMSTTSKGMLRQSLLGHVSPLALARHVHSAVLREGRSPTAGAFQLVELLACVRDASSVEIDPQLADVRRAACAEAEAGIRALLSEVRASAAEQLGSHTSFGRYATTIAGQQEEVAK